MVATKKTQDKPAAGRTPRPRAAVAAEGAEGIPTSASEWKSGVQGTLITVPSGKKITVRIVGMSAFLKKGLIPNALIPVIQAAMQAGKLDTDEVDLGSMFEDPEKLQSLVELCDNVTVDVAISPKVHPIPNDAKGKPLPLESDERDPGKLYVDEMDFNDKMYIFNFAVGGTADLELFRQE